MFRLLARRRERRERRQALKIRHFERLLVITPTQFEHEVAALLKEQGFRRAVVSGGANDLTADITGRDESGRSVIVQCKRYAPNRSVGSPEIQTFIGMATTHHKADRLLYVTTARFTRAATDLAHKHNVELIDGAKLAELLAETRGLPETPEHFTIRELLESGMSSAYAQQLIQQQSERQQADLERAKLSGCSCATSTRHWQMDGDTWNEYRQFVVRCRACGRVATEQEVAAMRQDLEAHVASDPKLKSRHRLPRSHRRR